MQRYLRKLLALPISLQIALSSGMAPHAFAQSVPAPSSSSQSAPPAFEQALSELEEAQEGSLPQTKSDAFHLTGQTLEILQGRRAGHYSLSNPNLDLPAVIAPDYDRDVITRIDPTTGRVSLDLVVKGQVIARHLLSADITAAAVTQDKELLTILATNGDLYVVDVGYSRTNAFTSPLPVVRLLNTGVLASQQDGTHISFITRGLQPFSLRDTPADAIVPLDRDARVQSEPGDSLVAGDLLIYRQTPEGRKFLGLLDRSVIKTQLYTAEAVIAMMAFQVSPPDDADAALASLAKAQKDADVQRESANQSDNQNPLVRDALSALPMGVVQSLLARAQSNRGDITRPRDRFSLAEWATQFERLRAHAMAGFEEDKKVDEALRTRVRQGLLQGNFGSDWQAIAQSAQRPAQEESRWIPRLLFHRFMKPKAMKIIAVIAAGGAAMSGVDIHLLGGSGAAWAVHLTNQLYNDFVPEVLKDQAYRITLLKSSLYLSAFVPLLWASGLISSKVRGVPWSAAKSIAAGGMRIYGELMLPFYHRLAKLARQPNFIKSLQNGISPLTLVRADSDLGRAVGLQSDTRVGVNNPFLTGQAHQDNVTVKAKALSKLAEEERRKRALAWTLALLVASEQSELDPATLGALMQNDQAQLAQEQMEKLASDPAFQKKWANIAEELQHNLLKMQSGKMNEDLSTLSTDDLEAYYRLARETATAIEARKGMTKLLAQARNKWRKIKSNLGPNLANFGLAEYDFLKSAEPSNFVVSQFWKQFVIDYLLSVGQVAVIGDRANLHDPQALAAQEGEFLATSPGHRFDMIDQVRIYGINLPARMALVYQRVKPVTDGSYDPIENTSLTGVERADSLINGMRRWIMGASNVVDADYGGIWLRSLSRSIKTIQANLVMALAGRVLFANQPLGEAIPAFAFGMVWGMWAFGWMWEPINRGTQMYEEHIEEKREKLTNAKTTLGRGLRTGDSATILEGARALVQLYEQSSGPNGASSMNETLNQLESLIKELPAAELAKMQSELNASRNLTAELERAIQDGDIHRIKLAKQKLIDALTSDPAHTAILMRMNGLSLLEHALQTPPFATKPSKWQGWFTVGFGAVITTYYATAMSVDMFRPNISWAEKLIEATLLSAALYTGIYYGQKALAVGIEKTKDVIADIKRAKTQPRTCELVFTARGK